MDFPETEKLMTKKDQWVGHPECGFDSLSSASCGDFGHTILLSDSQDYVSRKWTYWHFPVPVCHHKRQNYTLDCSPEPLGQRAYLLHLPTRQQVRGALASQSLSPPKVEKSCPAHPLAPWCLSLVSLRELVFWRETCFLALPHSLHCKAWISHLT